MVDTSMRPFNLPLRQLEVLRLRAQGKSIHEIAAVMTISWASVNQYLLKAREATGLSTAQLVEQLGRWDEQHAAMISPLIGTGV